MTPYKRILRIVAIGSLVFSACHQASDQKFFDTSNMDTTVKPGDNFFLYANGGWLKTAQIPPTETSVGGFLDVYKKTQQHLKDILDDLAKDTSAAAGSLQQKVGDFYAAGMDSATIDRLGYEPVKPVLAKIEAIKDVKGLIQFVASEHTYGVPLLFNLQVGPDEKSSMVNIPSFYQGGLGLPDRDYYFKTDPATQGIVQAYQKYVLTLFTLTASDSTTAVKNVAAVYALEKQMAESHLTNVQLRDPQKNYNKMAVARLTKEEPNIGWQDLMAGLTIKTDSVNVGEPGYFTRLNALLSSTPIETWKWYLRFHVLSDASTALSTDFVNANFAYAKALTGQQKLKSRWERMIQSVDNNLGEALGQLYVNKYFTAEAKQRMQELVDNLQKAFEGRISKLDWMSDSTKQKATEKLHAFLKKIGYPDKWKDYSQVQIQKGKFFEAEMSARQNNYHFQVSKAGQKVDRTEWGMTPPTINAYYNPTFNEIVFPAGILQFPFFDLAADDAINYGGIGMAIGHEMTHGFDDQGALYDKDGNLRNWWSREDSTRFRSKTQLVIDQYNQFTVLDTLHVNGALTTGENIADIGGLAIAYDAFKLTKQGQGAEKIDGFTPEQRFFLSFAQIWRSKVKDERVRQLINIDPHSPPMYRVLGPLMNFDPFYAAFHVQQGDKMWKAENARIRIW